MTKNFFMKIVSILLISFASCGYLFAQKSGTQHWKSRNILSSVGLVETYDDSSKSWYPFGTSVLLDLDSKWPHVFLVTNRHIYFARDTFRVQINFYNEIESGLTYKSRPFIFSKKQPSFVPSTKDSDFVVILIKRPKFAGFNPISLDEIRFTETLEYGEDVEFYGFPLYRSIGLHKSTFKFPLLRRGAISYFASDASVQALLPSMFLIDGASFGGGSGSPVFSKTILIDDSHTVKYERKFIGIIKGHFPIQTSIEMELISRVIEDFDSDSIDIDEFVRNVKFSSKQNSDIAIVISSDILVLYIINHYKAYKEKSP